MTALTFDSTARTAHRLATRREDYIAQQENAILNALADDLRNAADLTERLALVQEAGERLGRMQ